ncbi:hypothetical protein KP806_19115 [Paenibacillus sp. N4]|uniref:hypothetical protein n=1 Tax=Paenibacillus vietnamensis TaxID=2590547 RepID=UPI001CD06B65|nr:hypothetical protein [Paenibacillus vietnamensis]MCA0757178.1 hypothetical protein [Paenibacillus vietnamensis]
MSEFSASYHLKAGDREEAIALIRNAGHQGYVYPEQNGWVTFVVRGDVFEVNEEIIAANTGLLVYYIYAEDHGWGMRIFQKNEPVFEYSADWNEELRIEKPTYDLELIRKLIGEQGNSDEGIEALFETDEEEMFGLDEPPAYTIAESLGLTYFAWVSADYLENDGVDPSIAEVE